MRTDIEHCQGYVPKGTHQKYWSLTQKEKADILDFLMTSTTSNSKYLKEIVSTDTKSHSQD